MFLVTDHEFNFQLPNINQDAEEGRQPGVCQPYTVLT